MGNVVSNMAFQPPPSSYDNNISYLEFITREDMNQSLMDIYQKIPLRYYVKNKDLPTMIICGSNAEDIGQTNPRTLADEFNSNICLFDYAGYGLHSNRVASEYSCQKDVVAVYTHLIKNKNLSAESIVIYGRSLGSGLATYLSHYLCKRSITNKLILVSPLYSAANVVTNLYVPGDIFKNYLLAPDIHSQVLILHGNKDNVVPYICGLNLSSLFPNLHRFITLDNCGHNDITISDYYTEILNFISM